MPLPGFPGVAYNPATNRVLSPTAPLRLQLREPADDREFRQWRESLPDAVRRTVREDGFRQPKWRVRKMLDYETVPDTGVVRFETRQVSRMVRRGSFLPLFCRC